MRVEQLWCYPLKSAQGREVAQVAVGAQGFRSDRGWAVVDDATGFVLTARREPRLLDLTATLAPAGAGPSHGDGGADLERRIEIRSTTDPTPLDDDALSALLGRAVHVEVARPGVRSTYENVLDAEDEAASGWISWQGPAGTFHDSTRTQVSIISLASADPWPVRRFRPNVVLDRGEDDLVGQRVRMGTAVLDVVKRIDRCVITTRPQPGGIERDLDVLRTINRERGSCLGVGALVAEPGTVTVGDEAVVLGPIPAVPLDG